MITYIQNNKKYIIDEASGKTEIIDLGLLAQEVESLNNEILGLEQIYNDDTALLQWARDNFRGLSGLDTLKNLKSEREGLL